MFVTDQDLNGITAEKVNQLINVVIQKAVEESLKMLPYVVNNLVLQIANAKELSVQFYKDNPEFTAHKQIVSRTIEEIEGKNPGRPFEEILKEVTPIVKRRIEELNTAGRAINSVNFGELK